MTDSASPSFLRPAKVFWLFLVGLLVYGAVLVATVPAGWVWQQAAPRLKLPPQVRVEQVGGQLWDGAAALSFDNRRLRVDWNIRPPSLSDLTLPVGFSLSSVSSSLDGEAILSWPESASVTASGAIRVREFEDLIRQSGGAMLEGDITVENIQFSLDQEGLARARGLATWPGGLVSWPMGNAMQTADFPPMQALLQDRGEQEGRVALLISELGQTTPVAEADVFPDGMLEIRVYKRLVDLAGQSWSGAAQPGDVIFRVRQPILPGRSR
ncbi:type II secretion system protein N [Marinobacter sp.]|uniref:type II secretion system protein N n=1 Tax=Marinobacter sp. TaxID=50741 RepID=UPI00384F9D6A